MATDSTTGLGDPHDENTGVPPVIPPTSSDTTDAPTPRHARHALNPDTSNDTAETVAMPGSAAPVSPAAPPVAPSATSPVAPSVAPPDAQETVVLQPVGSAKLRHAAQNVQPVDFSERPSVLPTSPQAQMMMGTMPTPSGTSTAKTASNRSGDETQVLDPAVIQRIADADYESDTPTAEKNTPITPTPVVQPTPQPPARTASSPSAPPPASAPRPTARPQQSAPARRQTPPPTRRDDEWDDDEDDSKGGGISGGTMALVIVIVAIVCIAIGFGISYFMNRSTTATPEATSSTTAVGADMTACQDSVNRYNDSRNRWNTVVGDAAAAAQITADQVTDASTVENLSKALSAEVPELTQCSATMTPEQFQQTVDLNNTASDTLQQNADQVTSAASKVTDSAAAKTKSDQDAADQQTAAALATAKSQLSEQIAVAKEELEAATKELGTDDERVENYTIAITTAQTMLDSETADAAQLTSQATALSAQTEAMKAIVVAASSVITPTATPSESAAEGDGEDDDNSVVVE